MKMVDTFIFEICVKHGACLMNKTKEKLHAGNLFSLVWCFAVTSQIIPSFFWKLCLLQTHKLDIIHDNKDSDVNVLICIEWPNVQKVPLWMIYK